MYNFFPSNIEQYIIWNCLIFQLNRLSTRFIEEKTEKIQKESAKATKTRTFKVKSTGKSVKTSIKDTKITNKTSKSIAKTAKTSTEVAKAPKTRAAKAKAAENALMVKVLCNQTNKIISKIYLNPLKLVFISNVLYFITYYFTFTVIHIITSKYSRFRNKKKLVMRFWEMKRRTALFQTLTVAPKK